MPRSKRAALLAIAASAALVAGMAAQGATAYADPSSPGPQQPPATSKGKSGDVRNVGPDYNQGKKMPLDKKSVQRLRAQRTARAAATTPPEVGDDKTWLANDDTDGSIYAKNYTLRGIGDHIQVWVADDRAFPAGDCRNALGLTDITDAQVNSFVSEFDSNIYPKESKTFSVPPSRDGTGGAGLAGQLGLPADYYKVTKKQADDIVVLVDNVKDSNFYDPSTPDGQTYIAGFFYSVFNEYVDRNVMTIDAYDWLHRTGATPPDNSSDPAYVACAQSQGQPAGRAYGSPRPHLYEGTFAHEYQHLLEYYEDSDEVPWVNEGLSDWAQTLVGYVNPKVSPDAAGADSHLSCFAGFQPPTFGGPENSLTLWGDQGGPEILCDYGAAYSFMEYLASHYGQSFMSDLHKQDANGLAGLNKVLKQYGAGVTAQETIHRWAAMEALDQKLDSNKGKLQGGDPASFTASSLSSKINWANPQAYDAPGAPANGSDYVRLRKGTTFLNAGQVGTIDFKGAQGLEPEPVEWTVAPTPPAATTASTTCGSIPAGAGPAALYSGCGPNLDRSIVHEATVPTGNATMSFKALWDTEEGWDFGFVQVSDDQGKTWKSVPTQDTTTETDPDADALVKANVPGLTGDSGTWKTENANLSAYAGKNVLVAFRYVSDGGVNEGGLWIKDVSVGGTAIPSATLDGWRTMTQVSPIPVAGWTVQLVAYDATGKAYIHRMKLNKSFRGSLIGKEVRQALGGKATTVAAIVTYDDPSETSTVEARYSLKVNGKLQPGG